MMINAVEKSQNYLKGEKMKKILGAAALAGALFAFTGCGVGAIGSGGPNGIVFTDTTVPLSGNGTGTKEGTAVCTGILAVAAFGDCSVEAAAKNGGISQIQSVDAKIFNILGLYTTYTTIVKGR